jgi:hypothetical protein
MMHVDFKFTKADGQFEVDADGSDKEKVGTRIERGERSSAIGKLIYDILWCLGRRL